MAACRKGNTIRYCISNGRCICENADLQAKLDQAIAELAAPVLKEEAQREKRQRIALESDLRRTGRNNAVYVVKVRGQFVISDAPHPMPFVRAFSGEHPSKHALAFIERVTISQRA